MRVVSLMTSQSLHGCRKIIVIGGLGTKGVRVQLCLYHFLQRRMTVNPSMAIIQTQQRHN